MAGLVAYYGPGGWISVALTANDDGSLAVVLESRKGEQLSEHARLPWNSTVVEARIQLVAESTTRITELQAQRGGFVTIEYS